MLSDLAAVLEEIVRLNEDPDGFLVQLHVHADFDLPLFDQCVDAVEQYHAFVKADRLIDKRVVRFLYDTIITLDGANYQFSQNKLPGAKRVSDAHSLWLRLIDKLLTIEPPNPETGQQLTLI